MKLKLTAIVVAVVLWGCGTEMRFTKIEPRCLTNVSADGSTIDVDCGTYAFSFPAPKDGAQGATGAQGPQGVAGAQGPQGVAGAQGEPGKDAQVEVIELCPAIAGDGFHEYLLKINGALFGVYYDTGRTFMTKLKAGNYRTTDGRACYFSVGADGTVTQ